MTASSVENFFDNSVRSGAPSVKLSDINDGVLGTIVDQFMTEKKKFGSDEVEKDRDGNPIQQLVVILETDLRNWQRVSKIPLIDPNDKSKGEKPPSEDDGKRAVYIPPFTNIHAAVGRATAAANGGRPTGLANGAKFGLKVVDLEDVGKGNPKKIFVAHYEAPTAGQDFFSGGNQSQEQPQSAPAASQQQSAPAQTDPWSGQPASGGSTERETEPPF